MAKRSVALDEEAHALKYDPNRYPFQCLPSSKPPYIIACKACAFLSIGTSKHESLQAHRDHMNFHSAKEAGLCVSVD